jgi:predicted nucleotidyltransferase
MSPEQFADALRRALPEALKSVVLYGSAAAGDFVEGVSRYDVLLFVDPLGVEQLAALSPPVKAWVDVGNPLPQVMSPEELASSADAFPIELFDLKQSRRVLWGSDPLAAIDVKSGHLRWQLERELKGKLFLLREKYLLVCDRPEEMTRLLINSVSTFLVLIRSVLRLYEPAAAAAKRDNLHALAQHIPFDPQPFLSVLALKEGTLRRHDVDLPSLVQGYLAAIERIVRAVDGPIHHKPSQETSR